MSDLIVLANGYSRLTSDNQMLADGTSSLIKSGDELVLVDTLGPWNGEKLVKLINQQGYHLEDITHVICTHGHPDHIGNLNLFTNNTSKMINLIDTIENPLNSTLEYSKRRKSKIKMHLVGNSIYCDDKYDQNLFKEQVFQINNNIQVKKTPGHTFSCISVLVDNVVNKGKVTVAGDLFEKESDLNNERIWIEAGSESMELQKLNRKFILDYSDYIVPGHGPMFKINK